MENQIQVKDVEPRNVWKRGLFMLLFVIAFGLAQMVLNTIAIVQFLWLLFTREPNNPLVRFGNSLSMWLAMSPASKPVPPTRDPSPGALGHRPHSPAATTRSNRGFELSPRVRSSKMVCENRSGDCTLCTVEGSAFFAGPVRLPTRPSSSWNTRMLGRAMDIAYLVRRAPAK